MRQSPLCPTVKLNIGGAAPETMTSRRPRELAMRGEMVIMSQGEHTMRKRPLASLTEESDKETAGYQTPTESQPRCLSRCTEIGKSPSTDKVNQDSLLMLVTINWPERQKWQHQVRWKPSSSWRSNNLEPFPNTSLQSRLQLYM